MDHDNNIIEDATEHEADYNILNTKQNSMIESTFKAYFAFHVLSDNVPIKIMTNYNGSIKNIDKCKQL